MIGLNVDPLEGENEMSNDQMSNSTTHCLELLWLFSCNRVFFFFFDGLLVNNECCIDACLNAFLLSVSDRTWTVTQTDMIYYIVPKCSNLSVVFTAFFLNNTVIWTVQI